MVCTVMINDTQVRRVWVQYSLLPQMANKHTWILLPFAGNGPWNFNDLLGDGSSFPYGEFMMGLLKRGHIERDRVSKALYI